MKVIYKPTGRAAEYSEYALNIGMGCEHGCKYCYAPNVIFKNKNEYHGKFKIKKDLLKNLELDLKNEMPFKKPVLLSFINDPYQNEFTKMLTSDCINLFNKYSKSFQILTKGGLRSISHFKKYKKGDLFGTTLTFIDEKDSIEIEPKAALPKERINAIKEAKKNGIYTWVSFEPVIDADQVYELFEKTKEYVDLYKVGKISAFKSRVEDWHTFANNMIKLFKANKKSYYIKKDLLRYV